jgi:hypothetical protein
VRLLGFMPSKPMLHLDKRGLFFDTRLEEEMRGHVRLASPEQETSLLAKRAGMPVPTINLQLPCDLATIPRSEDAESVGASPQPNGGEGTSPRRPPVHAGW